MLYLLMILMPVLSIVLLPSALFTHIRLTGKNLKARRRRNRLATPSSVETGVG